MDNLTEEDVFEQQVRLSFQAAAVAFQWESLSGQELDSKANRFANYLQDQDLTASSIIGICFDRFINLIIRVLAIPKVGDAYLPLDRAYPADFSQSMIEKSFYFNNTISEIE